ASVLFRQPVDVGLDLVHDRLVEARRRGSYNELALGEASELPFRGGSFATVFGNCVLEHIREVDSVCCEAARVLRPGGLFVFTVLTDQFHELLLYPAIAQALRLRWLGDLYVKG